MAAKLIKGAEVAAEIRAELKKEVEELKAKQNLVPGLVTILVGQDPGSISYVTAKQKTSHELGFYSIQDNQEPDITEAALLALLDKYNKDPKIHGMLVQLPLPKHIDSNKVLYGINPDKDVDFATVSQKASFITPVPGGVGPMTITMLMKNTVMAAKLAAGLVKL